MSFDVFISYSTKDAAAAKAACAALESAKFRCWMAPRDIVAGARWGASIVRAINECRVMVLIFSGNANTSAQVHREVDQAFGKGKAVLPLRIEDIRPADELAYYLDTVHWLDALTPPLERNLEKLVATVQALLPTTEPEPAMSEPVADDAEAAREQDEARAEDERRLKEAEAAQSAEAAQRETEAAKTARQKQEAEAQRLAAERRQKEEDEKRRVEEAERRKREAAESKQRAEVERAFAKAKRADTIAALNTFFAAYPASHLAAEALTLGATLAERDEAYKRAIASDNAAVLKSFLGRYPSGKPADDVRKRLRRLEPRRLWRFRRSAPIGAGAVGIRSRWVLVRRGIVITGLLIVGVVSAALAITAYHAFALRQWQQANGPNLTISDAELGHVNSVSFSPDGKRFVTSSGTYYTNCKTALEFATCDKHPPGHGVQIWDVASVTVLLTLTGSEDDFGAVFSPDGREIAWEDKDGIKIADASTGKLIRSFGGARALVSFSPDSQLLLGQAQIWSVSTGRVVKTFPQHCTPAAAFSPDARRIVTQYEPGAGVADQEVCDVQTGRNLVTLSSSGFAKSMAFFPDGNKVIGTDSAAKIWDANSGAVIKVLQEPGVYIDHGSLSSDGRFIVGTGPTGDAVLLWNANSYALVRKLYSPMGSQTPATFSPDGRMLVVFGNKIEIWNLPGASS